jgi:hypothetical protein
MSTTIQFLSLVLALMVGASLLPGIESFGSIQLAASPSVSVLKASLSGNDDDEHFDNNDNNNSSRRSNNNRATETRRGILSRATTTASAWCCVLTTTAALTSIPSRASASSPEDDVKEMLDLIQQAKSQLDTIPTLLKEEKWDSVRSVLTEAPLRDCWSKSTPILKKYAEALGDTPKGDELAALEGREDLLQHLRFLDMAVYNNVFNPISTEGKTGASKALIDSYYNDPTREFEASKKAIEDLIQLGN